MFSTVLSATLQGLRVEFVQVEADVSNGLPMFHLVGYLSSEVKEAGDRVRSAVRNSGFVLPAKKMVINLSPANIRKKGTIFDLPIAVAVLAALEEFDEGKLKDVLFVGELSLDGSIKRVPGILPIVLEAQKQGVKRCIIPRENQKEGELVAEIDVVGVSNLQEVCELLKGNIHDKIKFSNSHEIQVFSPEIYDDFADIRGQHLVKRAAEIAVAGNHNLLMQGATGAGKTAIAKRIPSILPPLTLEESIELTMIYSILGEVDENHPLKTERPFREVNSTITQAALLGGGKYPRPGEISLAHKGVLFLDEIAEFPRGVMESLRKPMEDHNIKIIREKGEYEFPADFLLVAAMNPCPCGNYPDLNRCSCTTTQIQNYIGKLSQPFLDRIDICVEVQKVQYCDLANDARQESSVDIRERILKAREVQAERYKGEGILTNAQLNMQSMEKFCALGDSEKKIMEGAYERLGLSARSYHKVLRVARTIADLEGAENIAGKHLREALGYRTLEHGYRRHGR